jgi:hypothetical protein
VHYPLQPETKLRSEGHISNVADKGKMTLV